jgi:glycerol-3-phosphate dehydrogenase
MQRDLDNLAQRQFDLLVIGGGIYGAWAALDAAQRGLTVALIEQGDFCSATSANNHKIIHGGFRYLQHGDLRRMRESIRERRVLLQNAPGLVRPLPVVVPTSTSWSRHRLLLKGALVMNDVVGAQRNRGLAEDRRLPAGRLLTRTACSELAPGIDLADATGGAMFFDAQILSPERLVLSILERASESGAVLANYVRAAAYLRDGNRIVGVRAKDVLGGGTLEVRARLVLNCVGPWSAEQLLTMGRGRNAPDLEIFKAAVLVTRDIGLKCALAVPGRRQYKDTAEMLRKNYRNFFITPWRGLSLIGTFYAPHWGSASTCQVDEGELVAWLREINEACPSLGLTRPDVYRVLTGLLPRGGGVTSAEPQYAKRYRIIDHRHTHGVGGLMSVVGVKFTTARGVIEQAIDAVAEQLNARCGDCRTHVTTLESDPTLSQDVARASAEMQASPTALRAAMQKAAREQMACTLADAVLRRTDLAVAGAPATECLRECAAAMGDELGWGLMRRDREVCGVEGSFRGGGGIVHAA